LFIIIPPNTSDDNHSENNTPRFLGATMILAAIGAVAFARTNRVEE
jgi:hypothetical protein